MHTEKISVSKGTTQLISVIFCCESSTRGKTVLPVNNDGVCVMSIMARILRPWLEKFGSNATFERSLRESRSRVIALTYIFFFFVKCRSQISIMDLCTCIHLNTQYPLTSWLCTSSLNRREPRRRG